MAGDEVETVERAYTSWNARGVEGLLPFLADDVRLEDSATLPDARTTQGREAVAARLREVADSVGGGWVELKGIDPQAQGVLVTMLWKLGAAASPVGEVFHLVELAAGRITRIRVFTDLAEARAATS